MAKVIERGFAWLLQNRRGHDASLFHKSSPFAQHPHPTIPLSCTIGPSGSIIPPNYSIFQDGDFPSLTWTAQPAAAEYILIVEDPDAPLAEPVVHGLYYGIPANKTSVEADDFKESEEGIQFQLKGGFKHGLNRHKSVYIAPRGLLGHGPHRYFYQVVALSEKLDQKKLGLSASKEELVQCIQDKVISWGCWIGIWERKE